MEVKVLKTYEISDSLWKQIAEGFTESYNQIVTVEEMKTSFCVRNRLGYGYHAIALSDDGDLMGYNVFSPVFYKNGLKTVVSGSTYVRPKYRKHEMLFMNMVQALRKIVKADGYKVEIGVPNHNSEKFAKKILKLEYISELNYYILPFNLSKTLRKPSLQILDSCIRCLAKIHVFFSSLLGGLVNSKAKSCKYEMEHDSSFGDYRFGGGRYRSLNRGKYQAYWLLYDEDGANAAYLMDFRENGVRSSRALYQAVRAIIKDTSVDAILFVGFLRLKQTILLKVPKRYVPKRLPLTYYVLNKEDKDLYSDMQDKDNWDFSLMNFDVR